MSREVLLYRQEIRDALDRLNQAAPLWKELDYFFETAENGCLLTKDNCKKGTVIALGSSVPEELLLASGACCHRVFGGSMQTGAWGGDRLPRDADGVSRSALGYLIGAEDISPRDILILIPVVSDNNRKLAGILRQSGYRVHTIDFPPAKDLWAEEKWLRQWEDCREALSAHTGKRIGFRALGRACKDLSDCRAQIRRFLQIAYERRDLVSGSLRMFLLFSYFWATDIREWTFHLSVLVEEMKKTAQRRDLSGINHRANVLLMGSPVYFPNYKVPFLIEDAGMYISAHIDSTTWELAGVDGESDTKKLSASERAIQFYRNDCSGAYAQNRTLMERILQVIRQRPVDGVIYQVLKGQVEPDFEMERFEKCFEAQGLPVFRLETDYSSQDTGQLSIRLDAFMELLTQQRYRKGAKII
ncbi:MAG: 2-hydroxyacyl-CoA dehydratase family protein [Clostridiales bacterium]|nr:2-hydroxyacyl-CoA dehydratase family protein [Clostridiales bacterium]